MNDPKHVDELDAPLQLTLDTRRISRSGERFSFKPTYEALAALAEAHGLLEITRFKAEGVVLPWQKSGFELKGTLVADVIHPCRISLAPVPQAINTNLFARFAPLSDAERHTASMVDMDGAALYEFESEVPEFFESTKLEIGAMVHELFGLELDLYPEAPNAAVPERFQPSEEDEKEKSPFAKLEQWRAKS